MRRTVFDINTEDAHVDDLIQRVRIKSFFRAEQKRRLDYDGDVGARVGRGRNWYGSALRNEQWLMGTIQLMARAFDFELGVEPLMSPSEWLKIDKSSLWQLSAIYAGNPKFEERDEALRRDLCDLAGKIREAQGIPASVFAKRVNTDASKLVDWEEGNRPHYTMTTVQRHFRILGAPLRFNLKNAFSIDGKVVAVEFPECREELPLATAWLMRNSVTLLEQDQEIIISNGLRPEETVRFPLTVWQKWVRDGGGA